VQDWHSLQVVSFRPRLYFRPQPENAPTPNSPQATCHVRLMTRKDGGGRVASIEILKSTMRTREYVEKGESEGVQHFDGVLDGFIRDGLVDFEVALGFASNSGNLRLELQDHLDDPKTRRAQPRDSKEAEIEIER